MARQVSRAHNGLSLFLKKEIDPMRTLITVLVVALLLVGGVAAEGVKSGPQVGEKVPGPFHPLNVTGEAAGQKNCLYCSNGPNPVAVIFARDVNAEVTNLIKKLDAATAANTGCAMGSYVVFCSDAAGLEGKLKGLAQKEGLKKIVLSIDNPAGPEKYQIARDAEVTVLLYTDFTVKANHSFKKGDLNAKAIDKVVADVSKITKK
jgi:hypothetical protein